MNAVDNNGRTVMQLLTENGKNYDSVLQAHSDSSIEESSSVSNIDTSLEGNMRIMKHLGNECEASLIGNYSNIE